MTRIKFTITSKHAIKLRSIFNCFCIGSTLTKNAAYCLNQANKLNIGVATRSIQEAVMHTLAAQFFLNPAT